MHIRTDVCAGNAEMVSAARPADICEVMPIGANLSSMNWADIAVLCWHLRVVLLTNCSSDVDKAR